jgi:putative PIG3 family NAD(P)H quinone oxidoreductase
MKAVYIREFGGPEHLEVRQIADPRTPGEDEVLIRVRAAGLNRADLLQVRGSYPPPTGYSPNIPGLEFAGEVIAAGASAGRGRPGERVFGITAGEAQAEKLLITHDLIAPIPVNLSFKEAAAIPEAFVTAHDAVFSQARLRANQTLLIHAVGSGVGLAALQLGKAAGAFVVGTSRTEDKLERCREYGLDAAIETTEPHFAQAVFAATDGRGADVILELVGGSYFADDLACLAPKGVIMLVGLTGGSRSGFDLAAALKKRATIIGTVLRHRSREEKAAAMRHFEADVVPLLASGAVRPNLDKVFAAEEARAAYEYLASNNSFGKIVLEF